MKNKWFKKICTVAAATVFQFSALTTIGQTWSVGTPVNMNLSLLIKFGGGCFPNADVDFNFPPSQVTGVSHYAIIDSVPANNVYITPGMDTLATGDTVLLTPGTHSLYFFGGSGSIGITFKAIGTPQVVGQQYPCQALNNWISNLGICPDGLSLGLSFNCTVTGAAGVKNIASKIFSPVFPNAGNNFILDIKDIRMNKKVSIIDMRGEVVIADLNSEFINCSELANGIYALLIKSDTIPDLFYKFSIIH